MKTFNNIANLIKTKRIEHPERYSQMELSNLLGFKCNKLISRIEEAKCHVPLKTIPKLTKILNIHPDEFIKAVMKDHHESLERYFGKTFKKKTLDI